MNTISDKKVDLPDGKYDARWSAYFLEIRAKDSTPLVTIPTKIGVRGINCPVKVDIINGDVFESIK